MNKMEDKEKQNIRIILNRWLKRQHKIIEPNGKIRGYGISKNQIEKLKTKLWKNEDCQEEMPKTTLNSENNDLQRETNCPKGQNIIKVEGGSEEPFDVSHPDTKPEQDELIKEFTDELEIWIKENSSVSLYTVYFSASDLIKEINRLKEKCKEQDKGVIKK
jgi:hypothetical protein